MGQNVPLGEDPRPYGGLILVYSQVGAKPEQSHGQYCCSDRLDVTGIA